MAIPRIPVTGGCLRGAVLYRSKSAPVGGYYCHCIMCQKNYGGMYMASVKFRGPDFSIAKGEPKYYRSSSFARRGFCAECGSPVDYRYDGNPDVWILLGSLDRPADWPLTRDAAWGEILHVCVETKVAWHDIDDGLPQKTSTDMVSRAAAINYAADNPPGNAEP